jgi:hypothetical protein
VVPFLVRECSQRRRSPALRIDGDRRQRDGPLSVTIIRRWLQAVAELLEVSEIVKRFERP